MRTLIVGPFFLSRRARNRPRVEPAGAGGIGVLGRVPPRQPSRGEWLRPVLLGAFLFALASVGVLGMVRMSVGSLLDRRADFSVDDEIDRLHQVLVRGGMRALTGEVIERTSSLRGRQRIYLLVDGSNVPIAGNLGGWPTITSVEGGRVAFFAPSHLDDTELPVRGGVLDLGGQGRLLVGRVQTDREIFDRIIDRSMIGAGLLGLLLGSMVGLVAAKSARERLARVNGAIETVLRGKPGERIVLGAGGEFERLAVGFNGLLDRIDGLLAAMRGVTHDIAHDLLAPLRQLRRRLERAALASQNVSSGETELGAAVREIDAVIAAFNALLGIARAEGRAPGEEFEEVALDHVIEGVADLYLPLADEEGLLLRVAVERGLRVRGDSHLLFQAVASLVDNAVKYTPTGGIIDLGAAGDGSTIRLTVANSGPGAVEAAGMTALRPLGGHDEDNCLPGMGLGLRLVASIAALHQAHLELEDNGPRFHAALVFARGA